MELFVHRPTHEHPDVVEVQASALVRTLLIGSNSDHGVWLEEVDEEIELDLTFEQAGVGHHHHVHVGPCRHIEVVVRFNGEKFEHKFGPAKTIKGVQKWAFGPDGANLSAEQRAEHVLAQPGADHFLEDGVHISSLTDPGTCGVKLDLLPRSRFAG